MIPGGYRFDIPSVVCSILFFFFFFTPILLIVDGRLESGPASVTGCVAAHV